MSVFLDFPNSDLYQKSETIEMSSELIKRDTLDNIQDPVAFIVGLGNAFALSSMFGVKTKEQGQVLAMHCLMTKSSPLEIMQTFHLVDGSKLSMRADAILARFNARGGRHQVLQRDPSCASVKLIKDGVETTFTLKWDDCKNEPFAKGKDGLPSFNYSTPLKRMQMLWARVTSDAVRATDPGAVCGMYTPEELQDDPDAVPANVVEGEVIQRTAAEAMPAAQSPEPAKRTRKAKEPEAAPVTTPAAAVEAPQSAESSVAAVVAAADPVPATAPVEAPAAATAPAGLPKIVTDIIELRDYVGPRWPKGDFKNEIWPKVFTALKVPEGQTDEERFTKADEATRQKLLTWLNGERVKIDKLATSTDLNSFANQNPTTSAK